MVISVTLATQRLCGPASLSSHAHTSSLPPLNALPSSLQLPSFNSVPSSHLPPKPPFSLQLPAFLPPSFSPTYLSPLNAPPSSLRLPSFLNPTPTLPPSNSLSSSPDSLPLSLKLPPTPSLHSIRLPSFLLSSF